MDDEVTIKQEPLDDFGSENIFGYEQVENETNMKRIHMEPSENDRISILSEKPELITVCATDTIKIENQLYSFEQTLSEGDHAYALREDNSKNVFKSSKQFTFDEERPLIHECQRNCGRKFSTVTERALHESHEHKNVIRTIKCNFCKKQFDSFFALTRHMPEHRNVQRYVCTNCSECFRSYQDLQIHWKTNVGCIKDDLVPLKTIPDIVLEEPPKMPVVNALQPNEKNVSKNQTLPQEQTSFPYEKISNISSGYDMHLKLPSQFPLLKQLPSIKQQPLSFSEEIKEFTAKYQLKNNLVAKKRTSAVVINPITIKNQKRSKKSQKDNFEIISQYAIPKAIGSCGVDNVLLNTQIKEEPLDQYDEQLSAKSDEGIGSEITIKNEPMDDYIEVKNEALHDPVEDINSSNVFESHSDITYTNLEDTTTSNTMNTTEPLIKSSFSNGPVPLKSWKIFKLSNNSENKTFSNISMNFEGQLHATDVIPNKNIKILKMAPNAKIIKLSSLKVESFKNLNDTETKTTTASTLNQNSQTTSSFVPIKLPYSSAKSCLSTKSFEPELIKVKTEFSVIKERNQNSQTTSSFVPIKLPYSSAKSCINTESSEPESIKVKTEFPVIKEEVNDEKKSFMTILEEAIRNGKSNKRINCVPREILHFINHQPQKIKIIEDIQRQIQIAKSIPNTSPSAEEHIEENLCKEEHCNDSNADKNLESPAPTSFFFSINGLYHPDLNKARRIYPNYRFSWICPRCPKLYGQKRAFQGHLVSVHGMCREEFEQLIVEARPFQIEESARKYKKKKQKEEQIHRIKRISPEKTEKIPKLRFLTNSQLRCPKCNRFCSSRRMLNDHIAGDCSRKPLYQCSGCPKAFYSPQTLNCHMTIHTGELPHKCNFCDKRFRTRGQVTVHHRTHTGEKPFMCQICSQRFTHRETLISHLSRHIGMKRYRCYACGDHFSCISGLKAHHDLRPDTCGKVKLNTRAVGPRVRVVRGQVHFEPQPEINAYLRTEDPPEILSEIQNIQNTNSEE